MLHVEIKAMLHVEIKAMLHVEIKAMLHVEIKTIKKFYNFSIQSHPYHLIIKNLDTRKFHSYSSFLDENVVVYLLCHKVQ